MGCSLSIFEKNTQPQNSPSAGKMKDTYPKPNFMNACATTIPKIPIGLFISTEGLIEGSSLGS